MTALAMATKSRKAPKPVVDEARAAAIRYLALHGPIPVWVEGSWAAGETPTVERWLDTIEAWDADPRGGKAGGAATRRTSSGKGEPDPEAKARHEEAIAYVRSYVGTWGLPLDIRADRRWGTKYLKLTDGQVNALLAGKARDAERAAAAAKARHPRYEEAVAILTAWTPAEVRGNEFRQAMVLKYGAGVTLTDNMVEAILRSRPAAPAGPSSPEAPVITEGMWLLGETIIKVQRALATGSGQVYAKRLDPATGDFVYEAGLIRRMAGAVKMTLEQAGQFGLLYGRCIRCGRTLTDEYSIAHGIGKVCAGKGDWA